MESTISSAGFRLLAELQAGDHCSYKPYRQIVYSGDHKISLRIGVQEIELEQNKVLFVPKDQCVDFDHAVSGGVLFWFSESFTESRPELHYYITKSKYFKDEVFEVDASFLFYPMVESGVLKPFQYNLGGQVLRNTVMLNFLEFVFLQVILQSNLLPRVRIRETFKDPNYELVDRFLLLTRTEERNSPKVRDYVQRLNTTKSALDQACIQVYRYSAKKFLRGIILRRAKTLLQGTSLPIKEISYNLGFSQTSNFSAFFKKHTGLSPQQYRDTY